VCDVAHHQVPTSLAHAKKTMLLAKHHIEGIDTGASATDGNNEPASPTRPTKSQNRSSWLIGLDEQHLDGESSTDALGPLHKSHGGTFGAADKSSTLPRNFGGLSSSAGVGERVGEPTASVSNPNPDPNPGLLVWASVWANQQPV
jgi:hypothetical protein